MFHIQILNFFCKNTIFFVLLRPVKMLFII
jgi:hypothetical protein